ncbi:hypothetical protein GCM10027418_10970 [Mariniluteicoccus endophyticus]
MSNEVARPDDHPASGRTVHALDECGTVRHWLVSPAWEVPADDLDEVLAADGSPWHDTEAGLGRWVLTNGPDVTPCKEALHARRPLGDDPPTGAPEAGGEVAYHWSGHDLSGTWARLHTSADGLVDWSQFCFTPVYRIAAATTVLEVDQADRRRLLIASTGPWRAYLGGREVAASDTVTYMEPAEVSVDVFLPSRSSVLTVVSWQVACRECRHVLRVRVAGLPVRVVLPSPGADEWESAVAERALAAVGTDGWGSDDGCVRLVGPDGLRLAVTSEAGEDVVELVDGCASLDCVQPQASGLLARFGSIQVRLAGADPVRVPVHVTFPVGRLPQRHRDAPEGEPEAWRREFLEHASVRGGVGGALSAVALDPDREVTPDDVADALRMVRSRCDCADFETVGLVNLLHRARRWAPGLREDVLDALADMKYWIDEPGLDAMCWFTENHQLVWHTAELLVGQLLADRTFSNNGWTGAQHAEHGLQLAKDWIRARLAGGFSEFDSNAYLAIDTLALVSLAEHAHDTELRELAAGLADRVLISLAANSWRGIHGSAHGRSYVQTLRSSRLEETAPLSWVLFGVGALNDMTLPTAVVATAELYRVPEVARAIAVAQPDRYWAVQRYRGRHLFEHDLLDRQFGSDTAIFTTPHVMLASAQDYRPGLPGLQEHVWGATLGPECQVFVTHAPNTSYSPSARPNTWAGNRELPRVRQHHEVLLALYRLRDGDPMGFTHAWFPTSRLDEWTLSGPWAVGRRGDGYVAIACAGGVDLTQAGPDARHELRPRGDGRAWVCVVGDAPTHGDLATFAAGLPEPRFGRDLVEVAYAGREHALTWDGPFLVNGRPVDLEPDGSPRPFVPFESPFCEVVDGTLVARCGGLEHHVDLTRGRAL